MFPPKIYEIGRDLGLDKMDIDNVLSKKPSELEMVTSTSPVDVYKGVGRYGTVSVNDFK